MKANELSKVEFLNELFAVTTPDDYRPICMIAGETKDAIVRMSLLMAEMDKEQREKANSILMVLSANLKLFSDMKQAVDKTCIMLDIKIE